MKKTLGYVFLTLWLSHNLLSAEDPVIEEIRTLSKSLKSTEDEEQRQAAYKIAELFDKLAQPQRELFSEEIVVLHGALQKRNPPQIFQLNYWLVGGDKGFSKNVDFAHDLVLPIAQQNNYIAFSALAQIFQNGGGNRIKQDLDQCEHWCKRTIKHPKAKLTIKANAFTTLSSLFQHYFSDIKTKRFEAIEAASKALTLEHNTWRSRLLFRSIFTTSPFEEATLKHIGTKQEAPLLRLMYDLNDDTETKERILYRLQLIHIFGGASSIEEGYTPDVTKVIDYTESIDFSTYTLHE